MLPIGVELAVDQAVAGQATPKGPPTVSCQAFRATASIPEGIVSAPALLGRPVGLELGSLSRPLRLLRLRHPSDDKVTRGNLLANVEKLRLARVVRTLSTGERHTQSLVRIVQIASSQEPNREDSGVRRRR